MIITAGTYKGRKIFTPDEQVTRPTLSKVRMGVFNTLYSIMGDFEEKTFLDLFGGSGIIGLEALSRGFKSATVFEINKKSAEIIKKNYRTLGLISDLTIGDSLKILKKTNKHFDVTYIDPPYQSGIYEEALKNLNCEIAILEHNENINLSGYNIIKQKKYGDKIITYLQMITN